MTKILVIVPYRELQDLFDKAISQADTSGLDIRTTHVYGTDPRKLEYLSDYDIIVARGITSAAIGRFFPNIHRVDITISSSDLVSAIWQCKRDYGIRPVGILVADDGICNPEQLEDLVGMPISLVQIKDEDTVPTVIDQLSKQGCQVFIGGLTVCRICENLGVPYIHIKTGEAAVVRAVTEAVTAARTLDKERTRANLLATVLNNSKEAMLAINNYGVVIAANSPANQLFFNDSEERLYGRHVSSFYPDAQWMSTLETGVELEMIQSVNNEQLLVTQVPIMVDSESVGVLITLQSIETIRETEHKIRTEMHKKGLVARYHFSNILCGNAGMRQLIVKTLRYSQVDSNVFITGETGTGKELFAQSIHNASDRSAQPFVAVNCAALPEQLLESELFGYTEGAFSGAAKGGKPGLFELAHKGTIFLDEIGEMPILLQAKILRVLQEKEIRKIGGDQVVPVDVRIICATNLNIYDQIRKGLFRADLFYRINLLSVAIPPLRERKEDIGIIFRHFVTMFSSQFNLKVPVVTPDAILELERYRWPGNIRELRNCAERLIVLNSNARIDADAIKSLELGQEGTLGPIDTREVLTATPSAAASPVGEALPVSWNRLPADELYRRFVESGMSRERFSQMTGISRTTLWRKFSALEAFGSPETSSP